MSEKEVLNVLLGKAFQKSPQEIASNLYQKDDDGNPTETLIDNAQDIILSWDADRIARLKKSDVDTTELYNKAAKETEGKVHEKWEKALRTEFGVDVEGKLKGEDLRRAIKAAIANGNELPIDKLKVHPEFMAMEAQYRDQIAKKEQEYESKLEELKTTFAREQQWSEVSGLIRQAFKGLNPILPKDPSKAETQVEIFVNQGFRDFDYVKQSDGRLLVMKGGKRYEDAHGNPVFLDGLVKQNAERLYEFEQAPPAGNAGNNNDGKAPVTVKYKTEDDYWNAVTEAKDEGERTQVHAAWIAQGERGSE